MKELLSHPLFWLGVFGVQTLAVVYLLAKATVAARTAARADNLALDALVQEVDVLRQDLQTACVGLVAVGEKLLALEKEPASVVVQPTEPEELPVKQAGWMLKRGANPKDLVETLGFERAQAELLAHLEEVFRQLPREEETKEREMKHQGDGRT